MLDRDTFAGVAASTCRATGVRLFGSPFPQIYDDVYWSPLGIGDERSFWMVPFSPRDVE